MIKKFAEFVSESAVTEKKGDSYSKGCVMAYLDDLIPLVTGLQAKITPDELYEEEGDRSYGLEDEPHVTVLYGILSDEVSEKEVLDLIGGLDWHQPIVAGNPSLFENEKYDVLKLTVDAAWLKEANKKLCENLPYSNDYPDYTPHITIAYLKPGKGKDLIERLGEVREKVVPNKMVYSLPNGEKRILNEGIPQKDLHVYEVQCRDGEGTLKEILECIKSVGNMGHTFDVVIDPDAEGVSERTFNWDGDGSDSIAEIKVTQEPVNENFFKTQYRLNGPKKPANFGVLINGLKVQFIPSSSKDLDNLEGTDVKEELQKWLDHKFGKEMMMPDFQFEGAGYGFIISDKLIDNVIGKHLRT